MAVDSAIKYCIMQYVELVNLSALDRFARKHRDAAKWLANWRDVAGAATWRDLQDVRRNFPSADGVKLKSQVVVTVFNVKGNEYRLLTVIHYAAQRVIVSMFLRTRTRIERNGNKMSTTAAHRRNGDSYFDLIRIVPLRPIRTAKELDAAVNILTELAKSKPEKELDAGERDYLEAICMMVQRFEQQQRKLALPKLTPIDRVKFLMQELGMNVSDLGRVIGSQPNASLILHGKREMSKGQILKLAEHFSVSPALFME